MIRDMQKVALVQCYIHHATGKEVSISQPINARQKMLLNKAIVVAQQNLII